MKRLACLLSVLLSLSVGTVSARAHGGCWGGHGFCGWGHGCYGGGCWPWLSVGICGFGVSLGGYYPACGYGYSSPAYAAYPAYPTYSSPYTPAAYSQPAYQSAPTAYSQPVYAYRTVRTQTARPVTTAPVYSRVQPTVSPVSTQVAPARSNAQAAPADAQLSSGAQDILKLSRAQVGSSVIQSFVRNAQTPYNLTAADIVYLHSEGVSDEVIRSMLARTQALGVAVSNPRPASTSVAVN